MYRSRILNFADKMCHYRSSILGFVIWSTIVPKTESHGNDNEKRNHSNVIKLYFSPRYQVRALSKEYTSFHGDKRIY